SGELRVTAPAGGMLLRDGSVGPGGVVFARCHPDAAQVPGQLRKPGNDRSEPGPVAGCRGAPAPGAASAAGAVAALRPVSFSTGPSAGIGGKSEGRAGGVCGGTGGKSRGGGRAGSSGGPETR